MAPMLNSLVVLIISNVYLVTSQCPRTIQAPCSCATTRYEPISITCERGATFAGIINGLGQITDLIDSLSIINTPIDRLPAFGFQNYRIKRLVLNRNNLAQIDAQAFDGPLLNSLEELDLRNNNLGVVPQSGVPKLLALKTLVLVKNGLASIAPQAFANYQSRALLRRLELSANELRELPSDALAGLSGLEELDLDKNFLSTVPSVALASVRSTLQDLSLGVNLIEEVPIGSLNFPALKSLSLEVNKVSKIDPAAFQLVPNLVYLYLSGNRFTSINPLMFQFIGRLRVLSMASNAILRIPRDSFQYITNLVRLDLSECQITEIESGALQRIRNVQELVLHKNKFKEIPKDMFQDLNDLYSLNLKGNDISYVENRAWANLHTLRHLDISANKLQTLQNQTFMGTLERTNPQTARVLYLYENPWVCDERIDWLRTWLAENDDLTIDAPGYAQTICVKPVNMFRQAFRNLTRPATSATTTSTITPGKPPEPYVGTINEGDVRLSGLNLAAVVLGVILGILLLSILLLMVVRYFVSKSRRQQKQEDDEARRLGLGSSISGYQSSAYPGAESVHSLQSRPARGQYYLNRPWYWWF